ncbi:MAG: ATP-binding protein [Candidatus Sumerlaeota bacterium]|nr:ATP-binding protein [Candidatus Sumerlaeota bacterium]
MRFLYEQYMRYREEGIAAYRGSDGGKARFCFLRAAECLFKLAHYSDGSLRLARINNARRLVETAQAIPEMTKAPAKDLPEAVDEAKASTRGARWIMTANPGVRFDDIAGLADVKELILRRVLYPFRFPDITMRYKKRAGGGVLLYGPPGTGKTMLAKAIATELEAAFYSVKCSDIMSKWVGEAERNLKELFSSARQQKAAVVFLDETESLVSKRGSDSTIMNRVIPEFLAQVDGVDTKTSAILLLGATNRPWDMDEAALRPGRFGEIVHVGLPDSPARRQILDRLFEGVPMSDGVNIDQMAERTENFSGADLVGLVEQATDRPYSREVATGQPDMLTAADAEAALAGIRPSVTRSMLDRYRKFAVSRT